MSRDITHKPVVRSESHVKGAQILVGKETNLGVAPASFDPVACVVGGRRGSE